MDDDLKSGATEPDCAQKTPSGSQTLLRGLDVLELVTGGPINLTELASRTGLTKTTTHRLAAALVDRGYLTFVQREGYNLGPKLLELGYIASQQISLHRVARAHIEALSDQSGDTVHLGILEGDRALYLDKVSGNRRVDVRSRVGERQPLRSTGLGKALLLDEPESQWRHYFELEEAASPSRVSEAEFLRRMRDYAAAGRAFDLEENEDPIRCVAAPVRGASGRIVGAISLSSAAQYMDDERMNQLAGAVIATAKAISRGMGWAEQQVTQAGRRKARGAG